jgi:hypothetical protein
VRRHAGTTEKHMSKQLRQAVARRRGLAALGATVAAVLAFGAAATVANAADPAPETLWGPVRPWGLSVQTDDTDAVELGTTFTVQVDGTVQGVRFWKPPVNTGTHTGSLWTSSGRLLATAEFTDETAFGWQQVSFSEPVAVTEGTTYVVSYFAPEGKYAYTENFSGESESPSMEVPATDAGRFTYGQPGSFPTSTFKSTIYWVDPLFVPDPGSGTPTPPPTTPPPTADMPGPDNTGVPDGTVLTESGPLRITEPNTVIDGLDITGGVSVEAANVTIKNSKIHRNFQGDGVSVRNGNVTILDSELFGNANAIGYSSWAGYRLDIHGDRGDGVKMGTDTILQDSWIHDLFPSQTAHADAIQVQDGSTNIVIRHNTIDLSNSVGINSANAAVFIAPDFGPNTEGPILVEDNYFDGGGYTVYCVDGNNGEFVISNITFRNNTFGRTAEYGPVYVNVPVTWTNNTYADNGEPILL